MSFALNYSVRFRELTIPSLKEGIKIHVFGDVHRDTKSCDVDRWREWLKYTRDTQTDNTYYIYMGDLNDFASMGEKKRILHDIHETTRAKFDEIAERQNRFCAREMKHMKGRILACVEGNHSWQFQTGKYSDEDFAERMDSEFVGWLSHFTLQLQENQSGRRAQLYFVLCHGKAGGKTAGSSINQVSDLQKIFPIAHFYIMGHDHQRFANPAPAVLVPGSLGAIKQLPQYFCRSGSFKKAYEPEENNYEPTRLFKPASLGAIEIFAKFKREVGEGQDRIITILNART